MRTRAVRWDRQEVASDEAAEGALAKAPGRSAAPSREEEQGQDGDIGRYREEDGDIGRYREEDGEAPAPPPKPNQQAGGASGATGRVPQAREAVGEAMGRLRRGSKEKVEEAGRFVKGQSEREEAHLPKGADLPQAKEAVKRVLSFGRR